MELARLVEVLRACPLVVSVQASSASLADPDTLLKLALPSIDEGVRVLRLEGVEAICHIRRALPNALVIGLIKRAYEGSDVYITPTADEVRALIDTGCHVIAVDATGRARPDGSTFSELASLVHDAGLLVMADCDSVEAAGTAENEGADFIGTTLAGYTEARAATKGPDIELLRSVCAEVDVPVLAEGRYSLPWHVHAALRIGAAGIVVGGAINDPVKTTKALLPRVSPSQEVGAVDIGGTWIRCAKFSPDWQMIPGTLVRERLPLTRAHRESWIRRNVGDMERIGISTGGTVDPRTGEVWEAKPLIPEHEGTLFRDAVALNDGLATAWAHASLPQFAGKRVATLALGTGVGAGFVTEDRIMMGTRGEYPRINDLPLLRGFTIEEALGGLNLGADAPEPARELAREALSLAVQAIRAMWFPDVVLVSGAVGLAAWLESARKDLDLRPSPFGQDAGLYGAAAIALFPPSNF